MTKIAMIGAGSVVFVKNLLTDILSLPSMKECEIALHDIDPERLETAGMMARWTSGQFAAGAAVTEHADRRREAGATRAKLFDSYFRAGSKCSAACAVRIFNAVEPDDYAATR